MTANREQISLLELAVYVAVLRHLYPDASAERIQTLLRMRADIDVSISRVRSVLHA